MYKFAAESGARTAEWRELPPYMIGGLAEYLFKPKPGSKGVWRSPASYTPEEMEEFRRIKEDFLRKGYANLGIPYNPNADAEIGESGLTKESVLREAYRILGIRRKHNPGADEED